MEGSHVWKYVSVRHLRRDLFAVRILINFICFVSFYRCPITVPTGLAEFPHEIFPSPKPWVHKIFLDIVQYSELPRGGHFAAFQEPELFSNDVIMFVEKVEERIAAKKAEDKTESKSQ